MEVSSGGAISTRFIETDSVRWHIREISIEDMETEGELIESLQSQLDDIRENSGGRSAICRLVLNGRGPLHRTLRKEGFLEDILHSAIPVLAINVCKRRYNIFIFRTHFIYTDFFYSRSVGKVHDYPNFDSYFHR